MKYIVFTLAVLLGLLIAGVVIAAPSYRIERTLLPETDSAYELGTSTRAWLRVFSDELCLASDCRTSWSSVAPFPFTTTPNYGATANATGTPIWFQAGLQASSTSYLSTTNITGNATIGDATSDSLTLNASTITLGANQYNITRSMGTAPAGLSEVLNYNIDFTGDAGGTTEVFGRHMEISPTGANPIADVRNAYEGIIHDGSGQITLAYNQHDFIIMDGAGGCTDCIGFFQHMNSRAGAYINRAGNFVAGTSVLTNGGAIGTIKGFQTSDIGNTTQVGNAYSFFAGDTNATNTAAAFYAETTAGTGKYAFKGNGDAMNVFRGNTRIGSQADPVNTLDVTGTGTFTAGLGVATTTTLANSLVTIHGSSGATTTLSRGDNGNTTGEPLGTLAWWSNDATANGSGFKTYIRGMTENSAGTVYGLRLGTSNAGAPTDTMVITGAGNVGIGTTSPQYLFSVASPATDTNIRQLYDSDANCLENPETTGITVTCTSDEKLKEDIKDSELSAVEYLNGFRIRDYTVKASGDTVTGVVAQEVRETHPELVKDIAPEYTEEVVLPTGEVTTVTKTGETTAFVEIPSTWVLIKANQELAAQIQELDARVTALEQEKKVVAADSTTKGATGGAAAVVALGAAAYLITRRKEEV